MSDIAQRRGLYGQVSAKVAADLPVMYLYTPRNIVGMNAKVTGFRAIPDGMIRLPGLALTK